MNLRKQDKGSKLLEREITLARFMMSIHFAPFVCLYTCNDAALDGWILFKFVTVLSYEYVCTQYNFN
jgi:hypothetical protein